MSGTLKLRKHGDSIGEIIISQSERRNAISINMWRDFPVLLDRAASDQDIKVLVISGEGKDFSSGADISEFAALYSTQESTADFSETMNSAFASVAAFPLPVIAMIRGACIGGACGMALCCDLRFADDSAKFAVTPVRLGMVYPFENMRRLADLIGISSAKDMMYSARKVQSEQALQIGLVDRLFEPAKLETEVLEYCQTIASMSGEALATTKRMFADYETGQRKENDITKQLFLDAFSSEDFAEGYSAFTENRQPVFLKAGSSKNASE